MRDWVDVAPNVKRLAVIGEDALNVYLLGELLVDAGGRAAAGRILGSLAVPGVRPPLAHAVTHAHFDHQGSSHVLCERLGIPLWCGAAEREALETGDLARILPKPRSVSAWFEGLLAGPAHPVARVLREGDEVAAGFRVLETPGHTPGSISFWRAADRVLVLGDVAMNAHPLTRRKGLREPVPLGTVDAARNREALRRLAALAPAVVCFGHGAPLLDAARFRSFVDGLSLSRS